MILLVSVFGSVSSVLYAGIVVHERFERELDKAMTGDTRLHRYVPFWVRIHRARIWECKGGFVQPGDTPGPAAFNIKRA